MPRPKKLVPSYCKHRASGQAVCTINGVDHYLGPHGTVASRLEYDRLITEWLASGRSTAYGTPARGYAVIELVADFLRYARTYYGTDPRGPTPNFVRALRPVAKLYGRLPAEKFSVQEFKAVRQSLITPTRARSYINETMSRVTQVFKWAAGEGKLPASVPQNLAIIPGLKRGKTEARETAPILPVDDATVDATLPCLPAVVADMVRLQRLTGMRPAEVCILRPCDVDRSGDVWIYRPQSHKTQHHGRERVILIGPKGQSVLLRYLARDREAYCFQPRDSQLASARLRQDLIRRRAAAREWPAAEGSPSQVIAPSARERPTWPATRNPPASAEIAT